MLQMISGKDLAKLHLDLQVPSLLSAVLLKEASLSAFDDCALRRSFDDMSPIETLISLGCCFHVLAPYLGDEPALIEPLLTRADEILDDYAPHWIRHSLPPMDEWETFVRHDLETLGDFLMILSDAALGLHPAIGDICEILNEQAFVKSLAPMPLPANSGNIIRFPLERRV